MSCAAALAALLNAQNVAARREEAVNKARRFGGSPLELTWALSLPTGDCYAAWGAATEALAAEGYAPVDGLWVKQ